MSLRLAILSVLVLSSAAAITPHAEDEASDVATAAATITSAAFIAYPGGTPTPILTIPDLGIDAASIRSAGTTNASLTSFGIPQGRTYALLSTGEVTDIIGVPTDFASTNGSSVYRGAFDATVLRIGINVPAGHDCLLVEAQYLTEEYPEWVGSAFNDQVVVELNNHTWSVVNGSVVAPDDFAVDGAGSPLNVNEATMGASLGTSMDGETSPLALMTPITPGAHDVYISVLDLADPFYDTAVFFDGLRTFSRDGGASCFGRTDAVNAPIARFTFEGPLCSVEPATFTDVSSPKAGSKLLQATWSFGDGNGTLVAPWAGLVNHTFAPGSYTVSLLVEDSSGATDGTSQVVHVKGPKPGGNPNQPNC